MSLAALDPHDDGLLPSSSNPNADPSGASASAPSASNAAAQKPRRGRPPMAGGAPQGASGLRGQCWWLMRQLPNGFTVNQLLETYATGEEKDAHNNLTHYLARLEACGVVERLERREPGAALTSPGYVVWRLVRNLGLRAPVWRRAQRVLWDPNAACVVQPLAQPLAQPEEPGHAS